MLKVEFFQEYIDKDISIIPLKKTVDEKKQIITGKRSAVSGWNRFSDSLPEDEDVYSWVKLDNCSGIAYVCGEASNLCCVDIDTEDMELAKKIEDILPYTPCVIIGNPLRRGKFLFRLTEFPSTYQPPAQLKLQCKRHNEVVADIFYGNAYIVAPPSFHSSKADGSNAIYYKWEDPSKSLEKVGIDNLPVLPFDVPYKINQIIQGATKHEINLSGVSAESQKGEVIGRYNSMKANVSSMIKRRMPMEQVISELLALDARDNASNPYFTDKTKGHRSKQSVVNAIAYYAKMLEFCNQKGELELPRFEKKYSPVYHKEWSTYIPIKEKKMKIEAFDQALIPAKWRNLVVDVADANGVPQEICFYVLMTTLSALVGNKRIITAKQKNKSWEEAHNIWTIYVSPSGTRKTQVLKTLTKYINDIQKEIDSEYDEYIARETDNKTVNKKRLKLLERDLDKEIECSIAENAGEISPASKREIARIQEQIAKLKEETEIKEKKQLVVKGATPEKLVEILAANKTGTFLEYNELTHLTQMFKKKGYESLRTLLLDSWDGLRSYSYQTKNAGDCFIEKNCSSLYGAVQNSIFEQELREIAHGINDDGFYQRAFLIINDNPVAIALDQEFNYSAYTDAFTPFREAYLMGESSDKITTDHDAYLELMSFEQKMLGMAVSESISALGSFWGKFTGKVVKIASLLEFIKKGSDFREISYDSMITAIELMKRQIKHIRNLFPDPNYEHAREVIRLIKFGVIKDGIDHEKLVKAYRFLGDAKTCTEVLTILYSANAIDVITRDGMYYYYFNPEIAPQEE